MNKPKTGKIVSISGATVRTDLTDMTLFERVSVGIQNLTGEVVRQDKEGSTLQVYEDSSGLGLGEPVQGLGVSLSTTLGPGLLSVMFDGLQRPLESLANKTGSFIKPIYLPTSLDLHKEWSFIHRMSPGPERTKLRSKTFTGIASIRQLASSIIRRTIYTSKLELF